MSNLLVVLALLAMSNASAAKGTRPRPQRTSVAFSGEVRSGKGYTHKLAPHLEFRLLPSTDVSRYEIWLGDPAEPEDNYCTVVTPPFHGPNALWIWSGELASKSHGRLENLPGRNRLFKCVSDRREYREASWALQRVLWAPSKDEPRGTAAKAESLLGERQVAALAGSLRIKSFRLGADAGGGPAIEALAFSVKLDRVPSPP